jgi:hypothetical protein
MPKILAQAGISLADSYDVEGSIVGVEDLNAGDVSLIHEMGGTIMSERLQSFILRLVPTAPAASSNWTVSSGELPDCANRILGAIVVMPSANSTDITNCSISIQNGAIDRQFPFWTWDTGEDAEIRIRFNLDGAGPEDFRQLRPREGIQLPSLATRLGLGEQMPNIRFNGTTSAFGGGTVAIEAYVHICRPNPEVPSPGHPSSHGLPLPGW